MHTRVISIYRSFWERLYWNELRDISDSANQTKTGLQELSSCLSGACTLVQFGIWQGWLCHCRSNTLALSHSTFPLNAGLIHNTLRWNLFFQNQSEKSKYSPKGIYGHFFIVLNIMINSDPLEKILVENCRSQLNKKLLAFKKTINFVNNR